MGFVIVLLLGLSLVTACGKGSGSAGAPTGPTTAGAEATVVEAALRNRFLFDHNAAFNGGRTFRWIPPIPIFVLTGDQEIDDLVMQQFLAWEGALAGAGGTPFYQPEPSVRRVPRRGIYIVVADLPGNVVGIGNPFASTAAEGSRAARLRALNLPAAAIRRLEMPLVTAGGEIERCEMVLDPVLFEVSVAAFNHVVRHEVGHCLGFIGHVASRRSVMHASACCPLAITADIGRMMRTLYGQSPGTAVRR